MAKAKAKAKKGGELSVKGLALTGGIVWGGAVLGLALLNLEFPSYGVAALNVIDSIYPGYHPYFSGGGFLSIPVAGLYAGLDGAAVGAIFAWVYNKLK